MLGDKGFLVLGLLGLALALLAAQGGWMGVLSMRNLAGFFLERIESSVESLPPEIRNALKTTLYLSVPMSLVGAAGGIVYQCYGFLQVRLWGFIEKRCKVTMLFKSIDKHYDVVVDYIGVKCAVETGTIIASTKPRTRPSFAEMLAHWLGGKTKTPSLYYQPNLETQFSSFFLWADPEGTQHKIWISRHVEKPQFRAESGKQQQDPEVLILSIWWSTDATPLKDFMADALKTMLKEDSEGKVDIYVKHMWLPIWSKAVTKERRDRETVVLDENLAEYVVEDLRHFFTAKTADWYHNAGIPYRRGYLLYGPPGCGKTSFAQVLAGELGLDVCLMNLSNKDMNDDDLSELLRNAPGRSMLLLEDVDSIFVERSSGQDKKGGGVSFSGLLNALDGAAAQEGCVIMMTTNHKDRLDEALIRPGRCDVHVHITKASQDQAKRMYYRFFAPEVGIKSCDVGTGVLTADTAHGFETGDAVMYKKGAGAALSCAGIELADKQRLFVHVAACQSKALATQVKLYESAAHAQAGGSRGLMAVVGGKGSTLQALPDSAVRFSSRIPERQVSMAKLQGYLMKQKLTAEQNFKSRRDRGELPPMFKALDPASEEYKFHYDADIRNFAQEAAIMNVHELLDVKVEAEAVDVPIFDHLRRVGLHKFAPLFEYFGLRVKSELNQDMLPRLEHWHPDLKLDSPQKDRLVKLIKGDSKLDAAYALADLSVLRDRFIAAFQEEANKKEDASSPTPALPAPAAIEMVRSQSEPGHRPSSSSTRIMLLRQVSGDAKQDKLSILEFAHQFQERLESNGKTNVSMYQLQMHFQRYVSNPSGALENCRRLCHSSADRTAEERAVPWLTTFGFLRRLGLEQYAFTLEDNGYLLWSELKALTKDELKDKGEMSVQDAAICHAVLSANNDRPDLLRLFQIPEFGDLVNLFRARFPNTVAGQALELAVCFTDELGVAEFSCLQVQRYLERAKTAREAISGISDGLPTLARAQAARVRPKPPPPRKEPEDWLYCWLKKEELHCHHGAFQGEALETADDIIKAPLSHELLKDMGVRKLGERCKLLRMVEALK